MPAALFQAPQVLFQPPAAAAVPAAGGRDTGGSRDSGSRESGSRDSGSRDSGSRDSGSRESGSRESGDGAEAGADSDSGRPARRTARGGRGTRSSRGARVGGSPDDGLFSVDGTETADADSGAAGGPAGSADDGDEAASGRRRRRRSTRNRGRADAAGDDADGAAPEEPASDASEADGDGEADSDGDGDTDEAGASGRRRRRKRRRGSADTDVSSPDDPPDTVVHVREPHNPADDVRAIKGSTRLEAKKQRRREGRESGRRRPPVITESEFLARRESVDRTMIVRQRGDRTQIAVLEDGVLVEHYVNRTTHQSYVGNVYLGKVQNVLPSMEAAFVDIGKGRNAVLYAGEVNFDASGLEGQPKRIESALKPGQSVIVQVTKDPVGHKGARLTSQISLPGRYLVYVPGASMTGISRKLPDTERNRLKHILKKVIPENAGVIVRTAAEGAAEAELDRDVTRLAAQWENIEKKAKTATAPSLLYGEPDLTIRVVRDVFNEDFSKLIVSGDDGWDIIDEYVRYVAPHLAERLTRWEGDADGDDDVFFAYRIDEQLAKAMERKVWLPSGGSLVIDKTEAMTVIDVNTGKFTGHGGNLEETVTRNNLEAAEEIVRQLRLRDVGGIVVIDFIDMVLESNRELVLRRLLECLARDRTKHQVAEVTSLGLVQMTRKRVGAGLLEAFSQPCECCNGRGVIITLDQPEPAHRSSAGAPRRPAVGNSHDHGNGNGKGQGNGHGQGGGQSRRPGEDRSGQDQSASDQSASDHSAPEPDDARQGEPAQRGHAQGSGRRGRRDGRTNGGTASAALVKVPDAEVTTAPVASAPLTVEEVAPAAVVTVPATDSAGGPVRRTRAGSAVARITVTTDDPAPAPAPAAAVTPPPAEPMPLAEPMTPAEPLTPDDAVASVDATTSVDAAAPAGDVLSAETVPFAPDAAAAPDAAPAPADGAASPADTPATATEASAEYVPSTDQESPAGEARPVAELSSEAVTPQDTPVPEATAPDA